LIFNVVSSFSNTDNKKVSSKKNILLNNIVMRQLSLWGKQIASKLKTKFKVIELAVDEELTTLHVDQSNQMRKVDTSLNDLKAQAHSLRKSLGLLKIRGEGDWPKVIDTAFRRVDVNREALHALEQSLKRCLNLTCHFNAHHQAKVIDGAKDSITKMLLELSSAPSYLGEEERTRISDGVRLTRMPRKGC